MRRISLLVISLGFLARVAGAQELVIDAKQQPPSVETGFLRLGSSRSPDGHTIGATSRYLTRDGRPWLPVMGEFHFSRYPADRWEEEIRKMKAAGVQIVASYVFWNHHEEVEGRFDWSGQRDLRRFVELCARNGMLFYPRIGPWSHGESRNGGFPDWLVRRVGNGLRSNDSTYLRSVARFDEQIAAQLRELWWKDGGPVIGVQVENEYNQRGPGRGEEHILTLQRMARQAGMAAPLWSVTGWDNAVLPAAVVIPVFGGYPDMPWDASIQQLPPAEVYAFRFENRWAGNMGAQGPAQQPSATSQQALARYPFLGAEFGGGIQITYHRRPVIGPDDIAAMLPVQLGSGVNMYGYYMFHGGTNPPGVLTTLQESQRTGYPTDVPVKSYDFQAPLSEFGEMRPSLRKVKLVHYFLNEFGAELAPMVVRRPSVVPATPADTSVPRLSARTLGRRGFIFFNNHLRDYPMPARRGVQVRLELPDKTLLVPAAPIDVPSGAYFIWPVNLEMGGATLAYSTAQLMTRLRDAAGETYVFFAVPGIAPEFAFDAATVRDLAAPGAVITRAGGRAYVRGAKTGTGAAITFGGTTGRRVRIVLLSEAEAENAWRGHVAGADRLVLSPQDVFFGGDSIHLLSRGEPSFSLAVFPAIAMRGSAPLRRTGANGIFTRYSATLPAHPAAITVRKERDATPIPPVKTFNAVTWRTVEIALAPSDTAFDEAAARWRIDVAPGAMDGLRDVFLDIRYQGDVARLYAGGELLDDNFFNGTPWRVGLRRWAGAIRGGPLELRVLPLRSDAPVFIPAGYRPASAAAGGQVAEVQSVTAIPEYELTVTAGNPRR
jgi:hypothetical protein